VVVGTLVAFATGILAIAWLLRFLRTRSTLVFVVYRLLLGGLLLFLLGTGRMAPTPESAAMPPSHAAVGHSGE
jgi:undecaprenyl-diphosphatase